ncbi:hypothetical protein FACS1894185_5910 [Betaproteobacteria bacterium]|nr:hypothetical protein FACS1894185_5910 [Betaproteobacteria bacterium]GHU14762.1 hypothetical protein FACS189441_5200 [Betaproteobacteria bacterium]
MPRISVDRLQPGVFVSLAEIGWLNHPFLLSQFRINSEAQVHALREMGLAEVDWNPERSTVAPLPEAEVEEETDFGGLALAGMLDAKRARVARVQAQREMLARREREFLVIHHLSCQSPIFVRLFGFWVVLNHRHAADFGVLHHVSRGTK